VCDFKFLTTLWQCLHRQEASGFNGMQAAESVPVRKSVHKQKAEIKVRRPTYECLPHLSFGFKLGESKSRTSVGDCPLFIGTQGSAPREIVAAR